MVELTHMEIRMLENQTVFLKGKKENVLVNPNKEIIGNSKYTSRIIIFTSEKEGVGANKESVVIQGPGEYEIGGVEIKGYNGGAGGHIYIIEQDGLSIGVLGELDEPLSDKRIEKINGMDVLLAPVTIKNEVSAKLVLEWSKKWGVNYLVPTGFTNNEELLKKFLDVADEEGLEATESLKVEKDNLPEGLEIKVLKKV